MEIEKLQHFLKMRHKFDKKITEEAALDLIKTHNKNLVDILKEHPEKGLDVAIGEFFVDLLKICNSFDIEFAKTIKEKLKFEI